jgi:hypothetical protein
VSDLAKYKAGTITPGSVTVKVSATVDLASTTSSHKTLSFDLKINQNDPCNVKPTITAQQANYVDQVYTIGDGDSTGIKKITYQIPLYTVTPAECDIVHSLWSIDSNLGKKI